MYSKFLVTMQFSLLGAIAIYCGIPFFNVYSKIFGILSAVVGIWAILSMRLSNLNVQPIPKHNAILITTGIYSKLRHPMYTSLLLLMLSFLIHRFTFVSLAISCALCATLISKLTYEEQLLIQKFSEYSEYRKRTWRIIPFIF